MQCPIQLQNQKAELMTTTMTQTARAIRESQPSATPPRQPEGNQERHPEQTDSRQSPRRLSEAELLELQYEFVWY